MYVGQIKVKDKSVQIIKNFFERVVCAVGLYIQSLYEVLFNFPFSLLIEIFT